VLEVLPVRRRRGPRLGASLGDPRLQARGGRRGVGQAVLVGAARRRGARPQRLPRLPRGFGAAGGRRRAQGSPPRRGASGTLNASGLLRCEPRAPRPPCGVSASPQPSRVMQPLVLLVEDDTL